MYELHFGVPLSSSILNSINTHLDARTISVLLRHCELKLLFVDTLPQSLALEAISLFPPNESPRFSLIQDDYDDAGGSNSSPFTVDSRFCCKYESLVEKGNPNFK
ncbi:hypothetical protein J1N35_026626 [Gossypium stocksii]|uniref:Uncharacterized protein n=1 Tax=Gossypium stocksii TaxID=47602 RepID=A0A9D3ZZE4_9ROSI|nr:hypothetical protein J1N35_026626 [Gossypium stocksii]